MTNKFYNVRIKLVKGETKMTREYQKELPTLTIKNIMEALGCCRATAYNKLNRKNFTLEDFLKIHKYYKWHTFNEVIMIIEEAYERPKK